MVGHGQEVEHRFRVDARSIDASAQWSAGDVVLSLSSPSGRVIDRDTVADDVTHEVGPTYESYHVSSPEQGVWTATLYGAQVALQGEETRLDIYQPPAANTPPAARIRQTLSGRTVTVDGSASSDSDGSIVKYLWEFGDGATAEGPTASQAYTEPGTYLVTLATQDNRGRWDVVSAPTTVTIE
jgi:PKD repeat protein